MGVKLLMFCKRGGKEYFCVWRALKGSWVVFLWYQDSSLGLWIFPTQLHLVDFWQGVVDLLSQSKTYCHLLLRIPYVCFCPCKPSWHWLKVEPWICRLLVHLSHICIFSQKFVSSKLNWFYRFHEKGTFCPCLIFQPTIAWTYSL